MTTRRWMTVVAVVGVASSSWVLRQRANEYREKAAWCKREEVMEIILRDDVLKSAQQEENQTRWMRKIFGQNIDGQTMLQVGADLRARAESHASLAAYYGQLKHKYRAAARRPWLPVPPDPPPPE